MKYSLTWRIYATICDSLGVLSLSALLQNWQIDQTSWQIWHNAVPDSQGELCLESRQCRQSVYLDFAFTSHTLISDLAFKSNSFKKWLCHWQKGWRKRKIKPNEWIQQGISEWLTLVLVMTYFKHLWTEISNDIHKRDLFSLNIVWQAV